MHILDLPVEILSLVADYVPNRRARHRFLKAVNAVEEYYRDGIKNPRPLSEEAETFVWRKVHPKWTWSSDDENYDHDNNELVEVLMVSLPIYTMCIEFDEIFGFVTLETRISTQTENFVTREETGTYERFECVKGQTASLQWRPLEEAIP